MLDLPPERLDAALERLETTDRALLELSLKREVADVALAELMRLDATQVGRLRDSALERLAAELGVEPDDELAALLVDRWRRHAAPRLGEEGPPQEQPAAEEQVAEEPLAEEPVAREAGGEDEAAVQEATEPEQAEVERPEDHGEKTSRRAAILLVLIVALLGVALGTTVALLRDDDGQNAQVEQPAAPPEPPQPRQLRLQPLSGAKGASGSVRIAGQGRNARLVLRVRGLPRSAGGYASWLYDSVTDAVPVGRLDGRDGTFQAKLPAEPGEYRFIDVSREPRDGNPNHSGASVLRAPIAPLLPKR